MKSLLATLLVTSLFASPVFASGQHGGGHDSREKPKAKSHHADSASAAHEHGSNKGPVGSPAQPSQAQKTVMVNLTDAMRIEFKEDLSNIPSGTIIQFIVTNSGKIPHEFSIGNQEEQKAHAEMMRTMPGMTHSDGNTVTVEPGKTKFLTWHFDGDDMVVFACNIPGHYEAGMFVKSQLTSNAHAH